MPDAGWYRDPQDPSAEEYWDGQAWSGARRPSSNPGDGGSGDPQATTATQQPWGQRPVYGPPQGYGQPAYGALGYAPAAPKRRSRTLLVVAAAVVVVLVAAGVATVLLRSGTSPKITYHGQEIASADAPLTQAGKAVNALVSKEHGAKSGATRCYYAQPRTPASGTKASDVVDSLKCGPVLFVDGNRAEEYLSVPLNADTSGKQVVLTPDTSALGPDSLSAIPTGLTLVRPDDASAPAGNGGLSVPQPPPADRDSIIATALDADQAPASTLDSSMISKNVGVTLLSAGYIPRYGDGTDARSAPDGQRLIAFRISSEEGAIGSDAAHPTLVVDGSPRQIPATSGDDWVVAAVPTGSTPAIQLVADGYTQTVSLPDGKLGPGNIDVLARSSTSGYIGTNFSMHSILSKNGATENDKIAAAATGANLYFWTPLHPKDHPTSAGSAFLSVNLTYTNPSEPGKTLGYDPGLLHLQLTNGRTVNARNLARSGRIYNVFTVPADFTTGTLVVGGSADIGHGIRQKLQETKRISVDIPN